MGRRAFRAVAWGLAGLVVALVLTLGAFAIAGQEISEPASVPVLTPGASRPTPDATPSQEDDGQLGVTTPTETPSPSDDRGGSQTVVGGSDDDNSGPGSGSGDDNSGSGSGSDGSGSGSDGSRNGSDGSRSGSGSGSDDSSGPGSGEHEDD
jgi:hypothetical protein